jgi:hypothetical protein
MAQRTDTGKSCLGSSAGRVGEDCDASPRKTLPAHHSPARTNVASLIRDAVRLAAALLDDLFEHPEKIPTNLAHRRTSPFSCLSRFHNLLVYATLNLVPPSGLC